MAAAPRPKRATRAGMRAPWPSSAVFLLMLNGLVVALYGPPKDPDREEDGNLEQDGEIDE